MQSRVHDVTELKQRLLDVWHDMEQGVIDSAIDEWRRRIRACVWAKGDISSKRCENINDLLNSNVSTCISLKLCKICVILKFWICGSCGFFSDELKQICYATFILHSIPFPAVKEFWKSAQIWQSYCQSSAAPFFETQCICNITTVKRRLKYVNNDH